MQTTVWEPSIKHSLRTSRILSCARKLSKNLVTMTSPLVLTELKRTAWRIIQGSIWPVPSPPGNPWNKSISSGPGLGNCLRLSYPRSRGWGKSKISSLWFCEARAVHDGCGLQDYVFLKKDAGTCQSLYLKVCIWNECACDTYSNGF